MASSSTSTDSESSGARSDSESAETETGEGETGETGKARARPARTIASCYGAFHGACQGDLVAKDRLDILDGRTSTPSTFPWFS
jgi:hypothetical protein